MSRKLQTTNLNEYDLTEESFLFYNTRLAVKRVKDLDELVNRISDDEFGEDERLPYWAELWPSAIALSRFLFNNSSLIKDKNVLELGCGLGLTSLALFSQKPHKLLLTDYEQSALDFSIKNFELNGFPKPATQLLDWRKPNLKEKFNCIVGSDLVYEERFFEPLLNLFRNYLEHKSIIILAEPNRMVANEFFVLLKNHGFYDSYQTEKITQDNRNITVNIHIIAKNPL